MLEAHQELYSVNSKKTPPDIPIALQRKLSLYAAAAGAAGVSLLARNKVGEPLT